jgi:isopenicillin-N epimerase
MSAGALPPHSSLRDHWTLADDVVFLNHGSFGACPRAVLDFQGELRERAERQPVQFFSRDLPELLARARALLAAFVGADPDRLVFVPNTTAGVSTVLRALRFRPGDQLLTTDHAYPACRNALEWIARREGLEVRVARVPFPLASSGEVVEALVRELTPRTRLALIDHVTSPTGLVFPARELVRELKRRGVLSLVDGAHAPGMIELELDDLGADFYTGNCHKWMCAPKGAALLYADPEHHDALRPLAISHGGFESRATPTGRMQSAFSWTGTDDPTAYLAAARAIEFVGRLVDGGWPAVRRRNHDLALRGRALVCERLGVAPPCPAEMVGSLAAIPLPPDPGPPDDAFADVARLSWTLLEEARIEVPVFHWPAHPQRVLRISAHLHNRLEEYEYLARRLVDRV